jgi:hypothetical protein
VSGQQRGDDFEWHLRIDEQYLFNAPGAGARAMERELLARKSAEQHAAEYRGHRTPEERNWRRGAEGEETVGRCLAALPEGWRAIHDLAIGRKGANLDHLVIGPPAIFALNTKHLSGKVTVYDRAILQNGRKTDFLPAVRREAQIASRRLSAATGLLVVAHPVIVLMGPRVDIRGLPVDVRIVSWHDLTFLLVDYAPPWWSAGDRLRIERAARTPATWLPRHANDPQPPPRAPAQHYRDLTEPANGLVTRRWQKHGHDRLYVNTQEGVTLGYLDVVTGEIHVMAHEARNLVRKAVDAWCRRRTRP